MENIIEVSKLTKKFGDFKAVDEASFSIKKGEIFAFLGPNGAGKTTTIRILTTMLHPSSGKLMINGFDPVKQQRQTRESFGIVFQDPSLDNELTAYENMNFHGILYGVARELRKRRIEYLIKLVGLWDRKDDFIKTFSGGMKRRLEIARGLIHHPKVLFLDEPTLGLDPQTRAHVWEHLKHLNEKEGMTILFTTHYMEEAEKMADKIAIIDHGKIVSIGSPKELMKKTKTKSVEKAFLELTGKEIREEDLMNTLSKAAELGYVVTGNGYYLYLKGEISL